MRILFVCRGNTCRSPLAEAIARALNSDATLTFGSAGVAPSVIGGPASPGSLQAAQSAGLDLSQHQTRAAEASLLAAADLIIALDKNVLAELRTRSDAPLRGRLSLLMSHAGESGRDVADPFGGSADDYHRASDEIERGVRGLLDQIKRNRPKVRFAP